MKSSLTERVVQQRPRDTLPMKRLVDEQQGDVIVLSHLDHSDQALGRGGNANKMILTGALLEGRRGRIFTKFLETEWCVLSRDIFFEAGQHHGRHGVGVVRLHQAIANL